jgi:hypothetical protein
MIRHIQSEGRGSTPVAENHTMFHHLSTSKPGMSNWRPAGLMRPAAILSQIII